MACLTHMPYGILQNSGHGQPPSWVCNLWQCPAQLIVQLLTAGHYYSQSMTTAHNSCYWQLHGSLSMGSMLDTALTGLKIEKLRSRDEQCYHYAKPPTTSKHLNIRTSAGPRIRILPVFPMDILGAVNSWNNTVTRCVLLFDALPRWHPTSRPSC